MPVHDSNPVTETVLAEPDVGDSTGQTMLVGRRVFVVLATYNGARYVRQQIESIQAQTFRDWKLYVRDDGSRDDTMAQVRAMAAIDKRIVPVLDGLGNRGAVGNFGALMEVALDAGADYVFLSDQDDVWHPEKMDKMLHSMRQLETNSGNEVPLLVHSDLVVVDETLVEKAESFMRYARLLPVSVDLGVLLCQNRVTGCAAVINRKLLELSCPVPLQVLMHDWWLAQLAATAGMIGYLPEGLVKYRQHGGNVLGAVSLWTRVRRLLTSVGEWEKFSRLVRNSVVQAKLLQSRLVARDYRVSPIAEGRLSVYANLLEQPRLKRPLLLHRWKIGKPGWAKGWIFIMVVVGMKASRDE